MGDGRTKERLGRPEEVGGNHRDLRRARGWSWRKSLGRRGHRLLQRGAKVRGRIWGALTSDLGSAEQAA